MTLTDYPEITVMNLDPELLNKMGIEEQDGCLVVPVTKVIPAALMGSGLGSDTMLSGDYDIMTRDAKSFAELGLQELRFGDIVMIQDHCNDHGPDYCQGRGHDRRDHPWRQLHFRSRSGCYRLDELPHTEDQSQAGSERQSGKLFEF